MSGPVIALTTGSLPDAFALKEWFDDVPDLRGRSTVEIGPTQVGDLGVSPMFSSSPWGAAER